MKENSITYGVLIRVQNDYGIKILCNVQILECRIYEGQVQ